MTPKEQIQLDFTDGSKHFVLMVRREGKATGEDFLPELLLPNTGGMIKWVTLGPCKKKSYGRRSVTLLNTAL